MSTEFRDKLFAKCLKIYERTNSLWPAYRFLKRLDVEWPVHNDVWDNRLIPEIKRRHFPTMTVNSLLDESLVFYRSAPSPSSALINIWERLDWKIPFSTEEYEEFVDRFEKLLENESNPPTKKDWEELDEWLGK